MEHLAWVGGALLVAGICIRLLVVLAPPEGEERWHGEAEGHR